MISDDDYQAVEDRVVTAIADTVSKQSGDDGNWWYKVYFLGCEGIELTPLMALKSAINQFRDGFDI